MEKDNSGVEGAHKTEEVTERGAKYGARKIREGYHRHKLKPYRAAAKAEKAAFKANVEFQYQKLLQENPQLAASNPLSRYWQKQQIKKQYAKAVRTGGVKSAKTAADHTQKAAKKTSEFVTRHWKGVVLLIAALLLFIMTAAGVSSCSSLFSGLMNGVLGTSYTSEDSDLVAVENNYAAMENELQQRIDNIECDYPGYDEYRYDLDNIGHNPHALASYLTALLQSYTPQSAQAELERIFNMQYALTLTEEVEIRYRTETSTDPETGETTTEEVPYEYYILHTSDYSFGYVAGWSSGRELDELKSSLETIRSTAAEIINSIDEHLQEIQKERDKEQAQKGTTIEAAEPDKDTFSIYQLKRGDETRDFRFEPYDRLAATGHTAEQTNYDLIYTAELAPGTSLEDIYTRFNIDHPKDFKGHSLSVSDVVVLHQNGQDTAHYVDSSGYRQVPEFLQPPEKENPLKHVEDTIEQNDNHFDGIINNTPSVDELEKKAKSGEQISLTDLADAIKAEKTHGKGKEEKPSIRAQLKADKKKAQKKTARQKSQNLERS